MWGKVFYNAQKVTWALKGTWQGKRYYFSQMPTAQGLVPCESERMAKRLREMISVEIDNGNFVPGKYKASKPLILKNYKDTWLALKKHDLSTATYYDYSNSLNRHILPVLGNKYLPDINFDDLRDLQNKIKRGPKGKKNVMDCLKQLLRDAKASGYIAQIPEFPKFKGKNKITKPVIKYISQADQMLILENIPKKHRPIFLFMMATGCRPSEARALSKSDIQGEWVIFQNAFGRNEELKNVKQEKAEGFPLTEEIQQILDEQPKNLTQWVFPNPTTGEPYSKNINKIWNKACDKAQVPRINLYHATRHSFACQLLNNGVDKSIVSRLLRHSDPRMIERYAEYQMNPLKAAVENVRRVDFRNKKVAKK
jgi:integrase